MSKKLFANFINIIKNKNDCLINLSNVILILLILNMLSNNFGIFEESFMRFSSVCLLITIFLLFFLKNDILEKIIKKTFGLKREIIAGLVIIIFSFTVLLLANNRALWIISIPIFLSGIYLISVSLKVKNRKYGLLVFASFVYAFFIVCVDNIFFIWHYIQQLSLLSTQGLGFVTGKPLVLGPSASGFWILLSFLIFYFVFFYFSKENKKDFVLAVVGLFTAWIIYLLILSFSSFETTLDKVNSQYIFFFLGLVPTSIYYVKSKHLNLEISIPSFKKPFFKKVGLFILILVFISGFCLTTFFYSDSDKGKVVIYKKGTMGNWNKPEYGIYGISSAGMFGCLPEYLNEFGYDVEILDENVTESVFDGASVFVVINPDKNFTSEEHKLIWNFVENGGSLLVLGDHTDVGGMMLPLNNLLEPVGISFRYDSALPLNYDTHPQWFSCMEFMNHPITINLPDELWVSISVGASLNISETVSPVIIGKYAFSDTGNYSNDGFLGNYKHDEDEQLGDLILAACSYYGNGKVMVFGDTSSFQNMAVSRSYIMINNVFNWLNSNRTYSIEILQISMFFSLISLIFIMYIFSKQKSGFSIFIPIVLCLSLLASSFINPVLSNDLTIQGPLIYIDISHNERISFDINSECDLDGLIKNLARNNYSSFYSSSFSHYKINNSEGIIFVAPTIPFTKEEIIFIKNYVNAGGLVVLSTGFQDKQASQCLLNEFSLDIKNIPFGAFPWTGNSSQPTFVDAWPIEIIDDKNVTPFYSYTDNNSITYHFIVFKKYGSGGFLLIGDSQFLLDKNLESYNSRWQGNIDFFKRIITTLRDDMEVLS